MKVIFALSSVLLFLGGALFFGLFLRLLSADRERFRAARLATGGLQNLLRGELDTAADSDGSIASHGLAIKKSTDGYKVVRQRRLSIASLAHWRRLN